MKTIVMVLMMLGLSNIAYSQITEKDAIQAILGEARGEKHLGMLAVAGALRNRGSLKGVYGFNAKFKVSPEISSIAKQAWKESQKKDITNGATVWGNKSDIVLFKKKKWFKHFEQTVQIGNHYFFKQTGAA